MKNILLAVMGMTPQVLTETLYYLTQENNPGIHIDQIHVITTSTGRELAIEKLFGKNSEGYFYQFCKDYAIDPKSIDFSAENIHVLKNPNMEELDDIRSDVENSSIGNQILEIVKNLSGNPDSRIFASIAGGRKTMSLYLGFAMQIFGRKQDSLMHVLVPAQYEKSSMKGFYYPRPESQDKVNIELSEIPFIRLSEWYAVTDNVPEDYEGLVSSLQLAMDKKIEYPDIVLEKSQPHILFGDESIKLSPAEMALWSAFADQKLQNCMHPAQEKCGDCTDCFIEVPATEGVPEEFIKLVENAYMRYTVSPQDANRTGFIERLRIKEINLKMGEDKPKSSHAFWEARSRTNRKLKNNTPAYLFKRLFEIQAVDVSNQKLYGIRSDKSKLSHQN